MSVSTRPYIDPVEGLIARAKHTAAPLGLPTTASEWRAWHERTLRQVREMIGPYPDPAPLNVEVVERHDEGNYIREKVLYDSEAFATVPAWLFTPKDIAEGEKRPAILCAHGHGRGKDDPAGILPPQDDPNYAQMKERQSGVNYAQQLAEHGYVCLAPDWRGFGERTGPQEWRRGSRDGCNALYLGYGYLGFQLLALDIWDGMRGIDLLQGLPCVDPDRIGMIGLSFGGTMTTYLSALDERVRCADIVCYLSTLEDAIGHRGRGNTCGSQFARGLLTFGDIASVAGLIAPRPCLVEVGELDDCFVKDDALRCYADVERIYAAAGAPDRLDLDLHPGGHAFSGAKAFDWFAKWL